jgi:predicted metalloprotease
MRWNARGRSEDLEDRRDESLGGGGGGGFGGIHIGFYDELKQRFGAPGDFAQAYVLAHELGHHV